ncbi:death-associated protein kinase related [Musca autumnalis]|uniref:death-associated protein kinase related n=1 Tax=Musca autumnalis TaxID=221902 RepID=UPI003CE92C42
MFSEGIFPIGDGLLDIDEERLKGLLVPEDINEIYEVEQTPFARGKFAAVRRAIHKNSGVHFAAKFLKRRRRAQSSDKEIKHEIAVLMLCNDADNIVKLNAVHESRSDTALLLDLATGGELQTFLDNEECLNEGQARICMREVLKALQFLHKRSIVHLDLKPQNILLSGERIEDGLKLCDFGISRVVTEGTNVREIVGTPDYVAPEVLQYEPLSLATDIWSVGVLTYVLLSGFSPFGGETKQETFLNISQCALTFPDKLFGGVSSAAIDFIRKALRIKPGDRMTAAGCLEHIWLKDECSIDRHIFNNKLSNKQQLGHDEEEDDDDVDIDGDEEEDSSDDHAGAGAEEAADIDNVTEQQVDLSHNTSSIVEDHHHHEVVVVEEIGNVNDKPQAISVDNSEEEEEVDDDLLNTTNNTNNTSYQQQQQKYNNTNGYNNTTSTINSNTSTSNGHARNHLNGHINGHANGLTNGHTASSNGFAKTSGTSNGSTMSSSSSASSSSKSAKPMNTTTINNYTPPTTATTKTTVVHNVPATTKAITIPLSNVHHQQHFTASATTSPPSLDQQQQQQFLHIPARRQSSDSNKENTFLTTKKISPSTNGVGGVSSISNGIKKPHLTVTQQSNTTTTATILINPTSMGSNSSSMIPSNIVATITLPPNAAMTCNNSTSYSSSASSSLNVVSPTNSVSTTTVTNGTMNNNNNHNSFFPDAPTTPKVIRKAPNSDTSPTSVKALVKKFQLEGGEQPMNPPEFATNGSICNGGSPKQPAFAATTTTNNTTMKTNETKTKFINGRPSLQNPPNHHSTAIIINNTLRRASEPITAIHSVKKLGSSTTATSVTPVSIPPPLLASSNNLKSQCVYCNSCNAITNAAGITTITANNGCRHPSSNSSNNTAVATVVTTSALHKNGIASPFSHSTKSLINGSGSSSNGSLTSSSSNGTNTSTTSSNALLFAGSNHTSSSTHHSHHHPGHHSHHHHHHHHLHHHGVVKSAGAATNGLSLDQGIIC